MFLDGEKHLQNARFLAWKIYPTRRHLVNIPGFGGQSWREEGTREKDRTASFLLVQSSTVQTLLCVARGTLFESGCT